MTTSLSRVLGIILISVGALVLATVLFSLWQAQRMHAQITALGVILNIAPGAGLMAAGATMFVKPTRKTIAFWVAPLWVPFFIGAAYALLPTLRASGIVIIAAFAFAYAAMLILGLPTALFLRARRWSSLRTTTLVGAGAGLSAVYLGLISLLLADGAKVESWSVLGHPILLLSALAGMLVGSTYWAIARPDCQHPAHVA